LDASWHQEDTFHLQLAYKLFMYADNMTNGTKIMLKDWFTKKRALEILQKNQELKNCPILV